MSVPTDVTVLIPVRNRAPMLTQCLASVCRQRTRLRVQVLVVDDASDDGSGEIAKGFGVDVVRSVQNLGTAGARNLGLEHARASWVAFLDSDDWWAPDHLDTLWGGRGGSVIASTSALVASERGFRVVGSPRLRPIELRRPSDVLRPENAIALSASMARRDALLSVGGFADRAYGEDLDLWFRLLQRGTGRVLPRITVGYRSHEGQMSREPGMATTVRTIFNELDAAGLLPVRNRRALDTALVWDSRPRGQARWLIRAVGSGQLRPASLAWLLSARASQRHRWRLQWKRLPELISPPADPSSPDG